MMLALIASVLALSSSVEAADPLQALALDVQPLQTITLHVQPLQSSIEFDVIEPIEPTEHVHTKQVDFYDHYDSAHPKNLNEQRHVINRHQPQPCVRKIKKKRRFQLFVRCGGRTITIEVDSRHRSIAWVKEKIAEKFELKPSEQVLVFGGKPLRDNRTLNDYNINNANQGTVRRP
jgi:hypothetical protein